MCLRLYHLPSAHVTDDSIHRAVVGHPHTYLMRGMRYIQMPHRADAMDKAVVCLRRETERLIRECGVLPSSSVRGGEIAVTISLLGESFFSFCFCNFF